MRFVKRSLTLKKTSILSILLLLSLDAIALDLFEPKNNETVEKFLGNKYSENVTYTESDFKYLGHWDNGNQLNSFNAFKSSCYKILDDSNPEYKNWIAVCKKAISLTPKTDSEARVFFETNFTPYEILNNNSAHGLFTGYYEPIIKGNLTKTDVYNVPIYKTPEDLIKITNKNDTFSYGKYNNGSLVPYYSREEISKNNLFPKDDVLAWVSSKVDRSFLQIQGSGRIVIENGNDVLLGYDSQNGHPYRPIGRYILEKGYMDAKNISMQSIKEWLNQNPSKMDDVLNYDPSFVFFKYLNAKNAVGAQGVELTPGYSLAVDSKYYLYGIPIWLETDYYKDEQQNKENINRLMIAQDTGGAIRGPIRGDVFWGHGPEAEFNAGHMKNYGNIWILLPNYS
ncbi:murein transglycosylase A [Francisella frigiditurris]|uniref:Membrane-bound lytic murein transglycosylase A n=1 Tax=Francisella frigiditurris TaxID=1542390 RepID=A0A1J0KVT4_9GAMM|nr:MltA domain-containing protein [Francisella frigiditurris]APC97732.1 mltA specific insert domain protein [Francisella frigiditurris]